jgi:choline-sulfatase
MLGASLFLRVGRETHVAPGSAAGSNVLLITIDTLRADRVGAYGNPDGLTPAIDGLAKGAVRFEAAFTPVPETLPAHASILTGLEPFSHGIRNNTMFRLGETPTLATMLKRAGYRTGAFVGAFVLSARSGLNRDFDVYDDHFTQNPESAGVRSAERRAEYVVGPATEWILGSGAERPWFAWIHLYDPHAPYQAPSEYRSGRSPYDAEVAYTDAMIGRALDTLRAAHQLDRTVIVVAADHGEALGEHGEATHGLFAYDALLRVPMIVSAPGIRARVVQTPVASVDVAPTVLELLGIAVPSGLDGRSLLTADDRGRGSRALYFEALDANLTRGWAPLVGVMVDGWKYIDLPIPELYDLRHDRHEVHNLAGGDPARVRVLQARLKDAAASRKAAPEAVRTMMDAETSQRLASLGYIGSAAETNGRRAFSPADDPKNLVGLNEAFYAAINEQAAGHDQSALATFLDIVARRPDFFAARTSAAALLGGSGRSAEAIALLQSAPGALTSAAAQIELGLAFEAAGNLIEAAKCLERAVQLRDGDAETLSSLAVVYARLRRVDEARRLFRQVLRLEPRAPETWNNLGMLELSDGNRRAAVAAFRQAVSADAGYGPGWRGLGAALVATDAAGAVEAWRRAIALAPTDYDTMFNLGMVLAEGPQPLDALPYLTQFVARAPRDRYGRDVARATAAIGRLERR